MSVFEVMVLGMIAALKGWGYGGATVICPHAVAMAILRRYGDAIAHVHGGKEFKEGLLPTGAKLLRCQRGFPNPQWGYSLSCYSYDNADGVNVLQAVLELWRKNHYKK